MQQFGAQERVVAVAGRLDHFLKEVCNKKNWKRKPLETKTVMARTKQTARKKQPDPVPDGAATRPAPRPLNASFKERKLSKDWSETLNERHPHQNVNWADLLPAYKKAKTTLASTIEAPTRPRRRSRRPLMECKTGCWLEILNFYLRPDSNPRPPDRYSIELTFSVLHLQATC